MNILVRVFCCHSDGDEDSNHDLRQLFCLFLLFITY